MAVHPLPYDSERPARRVSQNLDRVVRSLGLPKVDAVSALFGQWEQVVGEDIARHCQPASLKEGTLTLMAVDQAWATELGWMESVLVEACEEALGEKLVESVRVTFRRPGAR